MKRAAQGAAVESWLAAAACGNDTAQPRPEADAVETADTAIHAPPQEDARSAEDASEVLEGATEGLAGGFQTGPDASPECPDRDADGVAPDVSRSPDITPDVPFVAADLPTWPCATAADCPPAQACHARVHLIGPCIVLPAAYATPCSDHDACTTGEACQDGACTGGKAPNIVECGGG